MDDRAGRLYVASYRDRHVRAFSASSLAELWTTSFTLNDYAVSVGADPLANHVYVVLRGVTPGSLVKLDGSTGAELGRTPVGGYPLDVAVSPARKRAYVTNNADNTLSVIDTESMQVLTTVAIGLGPVAVATEPKTQRIYVTHTDDDTLWVLDGTQLP